MGGIPSYLGHNIYGKRSATVRACPQILYYLGFGLLGVTRWRSIKEKWRTQFFFQNAVTPEIIVGIAPYLEHRRTLGAPSILHTLTLTLTLFLALHDLRPWHIANVREPFRIFLAYDGILPKLTRFLPYD